MTSALFGGAECGKNGNEIVVPITKIYYGIHGGSVKIEGGG